MSHGFPIRSAMMFTIPSTHAEAGGEEQWCAMLRLHGLKSVAYRISAQYREEFLSQSITGVTSDLESA